MRQLIHSGGVHFSRHIYLQNSTSYSLSFIYITSLFWFICKLLPPDECLHVSTSMLCAAWRKCFNLIPDTHFCARTKREKTATWHSKLGIYSCNFKRKSCGICELSEEEKSAVVLCSTNWAAKSTQLHARTLKRNKCAFNSVQYSWYDDAFFYCWREWITFFHRYPHFLLNLLLFTYVSFLLVEIYVYCLFGLRIAVVALKHIYAFMCTYAHK